ncbi:MAG: preprotein translocase subunit SecY [Epsilonproteobacteria bacterium]|nr:preprotein translocase subunit SecY [Campylobacterota bacterium]
MLLHNLKNIFFVAELRKKLAFTFAIFGVFRFGAHVPIPGIDVVALNNLFSSGFKSGFLTYMDMFSGGALSKFAIFALGIGPYITASIMMQILTIAVPSLEMLSKEGEYGRRIINQYTRYLTVLVSFLQAFSAVFLIERNPGIVVSPGWAFRLTAVLILTVGSLFVMWLGEQVNTHGLGNGSSMIIFAGIVASLPGAILKIIENVRLGQTDLLLVGLLILISLAVVSCIIFLEKGERRVPIQYARRIVGQKVYGGQSSYIPLKLNPTGVVPVIFAGAMLSMPATVVSLFAMKWPYLNRIVNEWFLGDRLIYNTLLAGLIMFFVYFYASIIFNPVELADNLRKSGGFVLGIRPGKRTAEYFDFLLTRIIFAGGLYIGFLAVAPSILKSIFAFPVMFSGVSLLIVIGVALDTSAQIETHLIERKYEGFLGAGRRLKGRYVR